MEEEIKLTKAEVVSKVKKLLSLAGGSNYDGEVGAAMNKVRELLAKYNLAMKDVEGNDRDTEKVNTKKIHDVSARYWQIQLARVISKYTNCISFLYRTNSGRKIGFVGMPTELEVCVYIFETVVKQMTSMMKKERVKLRKSRKKAGLPTKNRRATSEYTVGYALGIIEKINERLSARLSAESSGTALVLVKNPKVDDWANRNLRGKVNLGKKNYSNIGYDNGYVDGDKIRLNEAIKGKGSNKLLK